MTWKDGADERLLNFIASEIEEPGMVTSFVVVATVTKLDGDQDIAVNAANGQRSLETLGLLHGAIAIEEEGLRRHWFDWNDEDTP